MKCSLWGVILHTPQVVFCSDTLQGPGLILDPLNLSWLSNKPVFGVAGTAGRARIHASIRLTACALLWAGCRVGPWAHEVKQLMVSWRRRRQTRARRCAATPRVLPRGPYRLGRGVPQEPLSPLTAVKERRGGKSRVGASWAEPWQLTSKY